MLGSRLSCILRNDLGVIFKLVHPHILDARTNRRDSLRSDKYKYIAKAMGVEGVDDMTQEEYRKAAVDAVRKLSEDVGIPADLKAIVKEEDIPFLAQSAYDDACRPGNPRETSVEEIAELYKSLI